MNSVKNPINKVKATRNVVFVDGRLKVVYQGAT